jgi:predicted TIM-barrel fold metal-dependent hydrolase
VPNETYKAAAHIVTSGNKRRYSNVKIVLAHAGGSAPYLASRVAVLSHHQGSELTPRRNHRRLPHLYYETALAGFETNLVALESLVQPDRLLFGTDFPAVGPDMAAWYARHVDEYFAARQDGRREADARQRIRCYRACVTASRKSSRSVDGE